MSADESYPYKAKERVLELINYLEPLVKKDPEQEVRAPAIAVLDAALVDIKAAVPDDPVVRAVDDVISPEMVAAGESIRVCDLLLIVRQLNAAIGDRPVTLA